MAEYLSSTSLGGSMARRVHALVYWEDPLVSGLSFFIGLLLFFLMGVMGYPSVTVLAYALLLHILIRFGYRHGTAILGELNVIEKRTQPRTPEAFLKVEEVQTALPEIVEGINRALHAASSLMLADDTALALKWMAGLYALALASRMLGSTGLFFVVFLCAFTLPKGYEQKRDEVDAAMAKGMSLIKDISALAIDKLSELRKVPASKPAKKVE